MLFEARHEVLDGMSYGIDVKVVCDCEGVN